MVYRVEIKPTSSFIGSIQSNTLFGSFCYVYSNMVDENTFKKELENIVFSDLFYKDRLPLGIEQGEIKYKVKDRGVVKNETHSIIDRDKGRTLEVNGMYNEQVVYTSSNMEFLVSTSLEKSVLETVVNLMLLRGLGARKHKGKGSFELVNILSVDIDYTKSEKVIALSNFIPDADTSTDIEEIKVVCREGITTDGVIQNPLYMLSLGSVFKKDIKQRETCGQLVYDSLSKTYINAKTIMYPL